jgi:hypothetical protein
MAIDYKALRNQLDANVNQVGFAQKLATTFLEDIFKAAYEPTLSAAKKIQDPLETQTVDSGLPDIRSSTRTSTRLESSGTVSNVETTQEYIPETSQTFAPQQSHLFNYWFTKKSGPGNSWGTLGNLLQPSLLSKRLTSDFQVWKGVVGNLPEVFKQNLFTQSVWNRPFTIDDKLPEMPTATTIRTPGHYQSSSTTTSSDTVDFKSLTQNIYRDLAGESLPPEVTDPTQSDSQDAAMKKFFEVAAKRASEVDISLLEKYVSPTAAKGLKSLLDDLASGTLPTDVKLRMQRGDSFDPRAEALKLIVENPRHFAGIRSFAGMVSGFKASESQSAERIDQKKLLSQTTTGTGFRKALASEIGRVISTSAGTKMAGTKFTADARFQENAESAILQNLRTDLSSIAVKSGKQGSGLSLLLSQIGSPMQKATGFEGAIRGLGISKGESMRAYQSRLTRELERRTPKSLLESGSSYLMRSQQQLTTMRTLPEISSNSPFVIGTTTRFGL